MRKTVTIVLLMATLLLGVGAVYLGIRLSNENQAPDDSSAAEGEVRGPCTNNGEWGGCGSNGCGNREVSQCSNVNGSLKWVCHWDPTTCGGSGEDEANEPSDPGDTCSVTFPGGVTGCIQISDACGSNEYTFEYYWRAAPNGTTNGDCVGTSSNASTRKLKAGYHCPKNLGPGGCGYCVQLDGNGGGVAQFTGDCANPPQPVCGDGTKNGTEQCDPKASPTGCASGQVCGNNCKCSVTTSEVCGNGKMETGEECETGYETECTNGMSCNIATCLCEESACGDACTNDDTCPTDHVCDPSTSMCVLSQCLNNSECTNNGCTLPPGELPQTAIVSDKGDKIILALASVLLGVLLVKFDVWGYTKQAFRYVRTSFAESKLNKQRKMRADFENRITSDK